MCVFESCFSQDISPGVGRSDQRASGLKGLFLSNPSPSFLVCLFWPGVCFNPYKILFGLFGIV